jgi:hypothetical protein
VTNDSSPGTRQFPVPAWQEQAYPPPPGFARTPYFSSDFADEEDALDRWRAVAVLGGLAVTEGLIFGIFAALSYSALAMLVIVILLFFVWMIARAAAQSELAFALLGAIVVAVILMAILALPPPTQVSVLSRDTWWATVITEAAGTAALLLGIVRWMRISKHLDEEDVPAGPDSTLS